MSIVAAVTMEDLQSGSGEWLSDEQWTVLAADPLEGIETEYPHYVREVSGPDGLPAPSDRHPVFFGCYDWHSAVHAHWNLVRQLRLQPEHPDRTAIVDSIERRLTPENVAIEREYLAANPSFERPYGWIWLLRLDAELDCWDTQLATEWRGRLEPLVELLRNRCRDDLLADRRPDRTGYHGNSAFALAALHDVATVTDNGELRESVESTSLNWYGGDERLPLQFEPLGFDFHSPALTEADLMRRVLDPETFPRWLADALPVIETGEIADTDPVPITPDETDGMQLHFVGLNLARAWCLAGIAEALTDQSIAATCWKTGMDHAQAGLESAFPDAYAGSHWLSSFALYLLTRNDGGIAPGASSR